MRVVFFQYWFTFIVDAVRVVIDAPGAMLWAERPRVAEYAAKRRIVERLTGRRAHNPARADAIESQVLTCVEGETGEAIRAALAQMTDEELSGISPLMEYLDERQLNNVFCKVAAHQAENVEQLADSAEVSTNDEIVSDVDVGVLTVDVGWRGRGDGGRHDLKLQFSSMCLCCLEDLLRTLCAHWT